jgi:hypothetical protein
MVTFETAATVIFWYTAAKVNPVREWCVVFEMRFAAAQISWPSRRHANVLQFVAVSPPKSGEFLAVFYRWYLFGWSGEWFLNQQDKYI